MIDTNPIRRQDGWPVATPGEAGMDAGVLAEITAMLDDDFEYPNVHAVLIEHAGKLVYEHYRQGSDGVFGDRRFNVDSLHDLRSVSKSVTALLLGQAYGDDIGAALKAPITDFYPDYRDRLPRAARAVTLHHLLTMTAGFEWDQSSDSFDPEEDDEAAQFYAEDPIAFILERPLVDAPGDTWVYSSAMTELLVPIIEKRTGKTLRAFAESALFGPLGIDNYEWYGSWHWKPPGHPSAGWGLRLRARDLAKIGSVVLHEGAWQGKRILSPQWVSSVSQRHVDTISRWNARYGFGYQWWPIKSGSIPPYDIIGGMGKGGQRLLVVPQHRLVLTVFAGNYDSYQQDMGNRLLHRVVAARREYRG